MPSYKTHFPSTYLEKEDLKAEDGRYIEKRAVVATIASEKVGDDQKMVIYFQNMEKGMVGNRTNADTLADLYGEDTDGWIGREVILYVDPTVMYAGKRVGGLRLKAPQAPPVSRPATRPGDVIRGPVRTQTDRVVPRHDDGPKDDEPPANEDFR